MSEGLKLILESLEISINEIIKTKLEDLRLIKQIPKNQILFHYTDLEGLKNIIENKSFFFSNSSFLNDKQEFVKGFDTLGIIVKDKIGSSHDNNSKIILELLYKKIKETEKSNRFVACFSTIGDLLSQWRAYSNDGKGVCIGFDYNKLKKSFYGIDSFSIIYDDEIQTSILNFLLNEYIEFYLKDKDTLCEQFLLSNDNFLNLISVEIFNQTSKFVGQFKHNAFDEEKEFRFEIRIDDDIGNGRDILYRCGRNNLFVPYIKEEIIRKEDSVFPIKEIIIGPSLNSELNKISISSFLQKKGYNIEQIDIKESNVPYRI
ncbi:DUF2971 domain-containing protein [Flavobacterium sp.]|uniref:DUF2971 domain-containing protein n=1 Tax=Flavobacterium sp. TaxID=239 RepID=UPI002616FAEB|nr:DUF2971 domain-containing protein [Flavobacterium sp.]